MKTIRVRLKGRGYPIIIGSGLIKRCGSILKRAHIGSDAIIVTNARLWRLYRSQIESSLKAYGFSARFELVPDSEKAKSAKIAERLLSRISRYDKSKRVFLIAFGGGVIGDLAGFVAAVYKRGIPYVQIPTTLLAQVDSAIGGKVAIDMPIAKNLIGAFYQPRLVLSDIALTDSLSRRQIKNGLAEIIKYGVIKDAGLFAYLESNYQKLYIHDTKALEFIVTRCSLIKARLVEKDEFDTKGLRVILNYGHTIGHAIEAASSYSKRYNHGEAVALGMIAACRIASRLEILDDAVRIRIENLIKKAGLPGRIKGVRYNRLYEAHLHDKKFIRGKNRFILPVAIGSAKVVEAVPQAVIRDAVKSIF